MERAMALGRSIMSRGLPLGQGTARQAAGGQGGRGLARAPAQSSHQTPKWQQPRAGGGGHAAFILTGSRPLLGARPAGPRRADQRAFRATNVARMQKDLYKVLGVDRDASPSDIKKAYFKMAKKYHPDVNKEAGAKEKFAEINQAYEILSDDQKRQVYDMGGMDEHGNEQGFPGGFGGFGGFQGGNAEDIFKSFEEMFGEQVFGGGRRTARRQGEDLQATIPLTFEEAAKGCVKKAEVQMNDNCGPCSGSGAAPGSKARKCTYCNGRGETISSQMGGMFQVRSQCGPCKGRGEIIDKPCTSCRGKGKVLVRKSVDVDIPAGMDEGVRLRVPDKGEPGPVGSRPGSLYVSCTVSPHPFFQRQGDHLYVTIPISISKALLGGDVKVPTLDGEITTKLLPGTQPSSNKTLRSKGLRNIQTGTYGDLIVTFKVIVPKALTPKQREALAQYGEDEQEPSGAEPNTPSRRQQGFY